MSISNHLLATKLQVPPLAPSLVPRPALLKRLDEGLRQDRRLILVSAPAGYGKTTLLGEWVRQRGLPVAWISLDEGDNDPVRFLAYLITALRTIKPQVGAAALSVLQSSPSQPLEAVLTPLVNGMVEVQGSLLIALDDYHLIDVQAVHAATAFLLERLPPQAHLAIATRADPPLPLARLRGRGQLTELRLNDLRFTPDEAARFLEGALGLKPYPEDVATLTSRTEGWAAGLQMAAASMRGHEDITGFIHALTGSHRYVLDYLIEEVLQRQTEHVQAFLLQTSVLDRLCGPLCDALTGRTEEGQGILEALEHANLFIIPLDDRREWYRYHRLFADLLQQRLVQSQPEIVPTLHCRASLWYERRGLMEEAIEHALAAGDPQRAAELIERVAEIMFMRSEVVTLSGWIERLPEGELLGRPTLCVYHAWALLWSGSPLETVERRLKMVARDGGFSSRAAPLQAFVALLKGQIARTGDLSRRALEGLPEGESLLRSLATLLQANLSLVEGDTAAGIQALEEIAHASQQTGNVLIATLVLCHLAELRHKQGALRQAEALYQQALDLATDIGGRRLPVAGKALIGLGDLAWHRNDLDTAERLLKEGVELCKRWSRIGMFEGQVTLAMIREAKGDRAGAFETVKTLRAMAQQFDATEADDHIVDMIEARLHIRQGNLAPAHRWAEGRSLVAEASKAKEARVEDFITARLRKYEYPILARLWLAEGRHDDALELLDGLLTIAEQTDRKVLTLEAEILKALAHQAKAQTGRALASLGRAMALAEPEGFVRLFLDEGGPMEALLEALRPGLQDPALAAYVNRLLAALSPAPTPPTPTAQPEGPVEPLSEREFEVLRLLPSGLTGPEIAEELFITVNTLHTHLKNIYGKLGVHSRIQAVERARDLNLLQR